jgi:hypothetical protein
MSNLRTIAASVTAVFALGSAVAANAAVTTSPAAYAESLLSFTNMRFTVGGGSLCNTTAEVFATTGACRVDASNNTLVQILPGAFEKAEATVTYGPLGGPTVYNTTNDTGFQPLGTTFTATNSFGPDQAEWSNPLSPLRAGQAFTGSVIDKTFAGSQSQSTGNSLFDTASGFLHSRVSIAQAATEANGSSTQDLSTEFVVDLAAGTTLTVGFGFDMTRFWRGALGQPGVAATAESLFEVKVVKLQLNNDGSSTQIGQDLFVLNPTLAGMLSGSCTLVVDACSGTQPIFPDDGAEDPFRMALSGSAEAPNLGGDSYDNPLFNGVLFGTFSSSLTLSELPTGQYYKFTIKGLTDADAGTPRGVVPEPGILGLLGIGLLGAGISFRTRARSRK